MAYTRAQWEALQNRLPEEDRVSYDEYLRSIGRTFASPTPTAAKESGTIGATSISTQTPQSAKDAAAREGNLSQEDLAQIAAALANMQAQEKAGDDALKNALTGLNVIPGFDPIQQHLIQLKLTQRLTLVNSQVLLGYYLQMVLVGYNRLSLMMGNMIGMIIKAG
jgi:hypothetical protein